MYQPRESGATCIALPTTGVLKPCLLPLLGAHLTSRAAQQARPVPERMTDHE